MNQTFRRIDMFGDSDEDEVPPPETAIGSPPFDLRQISNIGGGRGVFATRHISAGSLILAEIPSLKWSLSHATLGNADILISTVGSVILSDTAHDSSRKLYPFRLDEVDSDEIRKIEELWSEEDIDRIMRQYNLSHQGAPIGRDEILRTTLALQHNGFTSGLYLLLCMINHSCHPNCIKFSPLRPNGWQCASEIWATRDIEANEELTICYFEPLEMVHLSRRRFLHSHHRFDCSCDRCLSSGSGGAEYNMSLLDMETVVEGLEHAVRDAITANPSRHSQAISTGRAKGAAMARDFVVQISELLERCIGVMTDMLRIAPPVPSLEETHRSRCSWTDEQCLLTRLLQTCVVAAAERIGAMQSMCTENPSVGEMRLLPASAEYAVLSCMLLHTQQHYLNPMHANLTQSLFDVVESVSLLLAQCRSQDRKADECFVTSLLSDSIRGNVSYFQCAINNINTTTGCIEFLKNVKSRYETLESMYKSTYTQLQSVLKVSSTCIC